MPIMLNIFDINRLFVKYFLERPLIGSGSELCIWMRTDPDLNYVGCGRIRINSNENDSLLKNMTVYKRHANVFPPGLSDAFLILIIKKHLLGYRTIPVITVYKTWYVLCELCQNFQGYTKLLKFVKKKIAVDGKVIQTLR